MKLIFVVQGEGRGHLTQALTLKKIVEDNGHEVVEVLVGKSPNREIPAFFKEKMGVKITSFLSPNFRPSKDNRRFNLFSSIVSNVLSVPEYVSSIVTIRRHIQESGADVVINFYELLCGVACGFFPLKVPEICVAHQYMFLHSHFHMPGKQRIPEAMLRLFTRVTSFGATARLALSIRNYPDDRRHHIKVVPPLLRSEVRTTSVTRGDYVMGYMLNAGFYADVISWHREHPDTPLHFFWDKKGAPEELKVDDTLTLHAINDEKFLQYMAGCQSYATTAGFESVCEALYMGKPAMLIPAHVEQLCNAVDAEKEGVGVRSDAFDISRLQEFARTYKEDKAFRVWENQADVRIMNAIESVVDGYSLPTIPRLVLAGYGSLTGEHSLMSRLRRW